MNEKTQDAGHELDKMNQTYRQTTGQAEKEVEAEGRRGQAVLGSTEPARSIGLDEIAGTFCEAWPHAMRFFNFAFMFAAWFPGMSKLIVMARGVVAAIDQHLIPVVCAAAPPAEAARRGTVGSGSEPSGGPDSGPPKRRDPIHR